MIDLSAILEYSHEGVFRNVLFACSVIFTVVIALVPFISFLNVFYVLDLS